MEEPSKRSAFRTFNTSTGSLDLKQDVSKSRTCSGNFFVDEHCLRDEGVTDFTKYAVNPDRELVRDIFLDEEPNRVG